MICIDNIEDLLKELHLTKKRPLLIAIDGRPLSGKTILATKLEELLNAEIIYLDEFLYLRINGLKI